MREDQLDSGTETLSYVDRDTGRVEKEQIYGRAALEFAYRTMPGRMIMRVIPHGMVSRAIGFANRLPGSKAKVSDFVRSLGIDASEAELPMSEYRSLDDFFSRRLKESARPIDPSPQRLVSPADGRTMVFPRIDHSELSIKGCMVSLPELLGDPGVASSYEGGTVVVVRLAPCDYHRFHFPDSGDASATRLVNGRLHSVHPFALESGARSFENKRTISVLESDGFGRLTLIEVGAFAVGSIVQTYVPGPVRRGQEKGYFRFGGSTVVLLLPPDRVHLDPDLVANSERGLETFVKMGVSIGSAAHP